jgi:Fe-S oxidoreductase
MKQVGWQLDPPPLQEGAGLELALPPGDEADQRACGLPGALLPDWQEAFLAAFGRALRRYRAFRHHLEACVGCGTCARACPFFLATGDPVNIPAARAELARKVYRRHFAPGRRPRPQALRRPLVERWHTYFYQCSLCRRCARWCPLGIDTAEVTRVCREILAAVGLTAAPAAAGAAQTYRTGNSRGISPASWISRNRNLEAELKRLTGQDIACPVDLHGAEVLLVAPAADLARFKATYRGYAKAFHAAGVSWTTSTYLAEADDWGGYLDFRNLRLIHRRVLEAARELKPRLILWGESGHGWRVARIWGATLAGSWAREDYLSLKAPMHVLEWAHHLLRRGAFAGRLQREANQGRVVTYHDPCHLARSCGLVAEPRDLIRAASPAFHDMPPDSVGPQTLCCGFGGGLAGWEDRTDLVCLAGFLPRARALAWSARHHGTNWVATACDLCKRGLSAALSHYRLDYAYGGVMELVGNALYPERGGS